MMTIMSAMIIMLALVASPLTAFAQIQGESLNISTDKKTYGYNQTIYLNMEDFNNGPAQTISTFESNPAVGFEDPCGLPYVGFDFLQGNYSSIHDYGQLVSMNGKSLNVLVPVPANIVSCPFTVKSYQKVVINETSHNATMTVLDNQGITMNHKMKLSATIPILYEYSTQVLEKKISPDTTYYYRDKQSLPAGTYTIIGFTQSGQISKPIVIEIANSTTIATSGLVGNSLKTTTLSSTGHLGTTLIEMFSIPGLFGTLMAANYRKTGKISKSFASAFVFLIVMTSSISVFVPGQAYATYSTSSQGDEAHGTGSGFNQATVEDDVNGFQVTQYGGSLPSGFSTQNNQFIEGFKVGTNFLWAQSFVQADYSTTNFNSHSCTDADGNSVNCYLPTSVNLTGVYNFWTDPSSGTTCPSGFTYDLASAECFQVGSGTTTSVPLSSSNTRLDLNAYQEIQSTGNVYLDEKYRVCSPSCSSYTTLNSHTAVGYAQAPQFGFYGTYYDGTTFWYGLAGTVGECGKCDDGAGRVQFHDGTYLTHVYTINNSATGQYRSSGTTSFPAEENSHLCWHGTISSAGSTTFTTTAKYSTSCSS